MQVFNKRYGKKYHVYTDSLKQWNNNLFFMVKDTQKKYLVVAGECFLAQKFEGVSLFAFKINGIDAEIRLVHLNHQNLLILQDIFPYLSPSVCGRQPSFGMADRLGIITPAHIEAFKRNDIFPILAQQSVRELTRTERNWGGVLEDTIWGCFEAGYEGPFGADADHIKEIEDIQKGIEYGYTLFTIDPSDHVTEGASGFGRQKLSAAYESVPDRKTHEKLYLGKEFSFNGNTFGFTQENLAHSAITYSKALDYVSKCYQYLQEHVKGKFEFEVSVDETSFSTSPLSHIFIVEELHRKKVEFQNLALHYTGSFQKAVDYIGDLDEYKREMKIHAEIARKLGGYKLSLHSGGLKYSAYPAFAKLTEGLFHIKISTSWLESMRIILRRNPSLYKRIHQYILKQFDLDRASYELTTDLSQIPDIKSIHEKDMESLLDNKDMRQVIHTTYGSILSGKDEMGNYLFREKVYQTLFENEKEHYHTVSDHVKKHVELLEY